MAQSPNCSPPKARESSLLQHIEELEPRWCKSEEKLLPDLLNSSCSPSE